MRIAIGCMRLSTDADREEARSLATLRAAIEAGVTTFDTAHAYAHDEGDLGHNERLLARATSDESAGWPSAPGHRIVTKCGMRRDDGVWIPDGRASRIIEDARASSRALRGGPLELLLLHAPDPRTSIATSARALARLRDEGIAKNVGVSNVTRKQLEEVALHVPVAAVEVALGAYDDLAIRSGVVSWCLERGVLLLAHAPLGGPQRASKLARDRVLKGVAAAHMGATAIEVFLAYLLAVRPEIVPVVGARRPETVASIAFASRLVLAEEHLDAIDQRFPVLGSLRNPGAAARRAPPSGPAPEVVLMMGVPGAGKSRAAEQLAERGYERLNRDLLGGTLRGIVRRLDDRLREGAARIVLDNTYVTRAVRNDVVRTAHRYGATVRCIFFDTPPHEAQVNVVLRMLDRFGHVLEPAELALKAREDPAALAPSALHRMTRDLEPPSEDEGFAEIAITTFVREHRPATQLRPAVMLPLDALEEREAAVAELLSSAPTGTACLLFAWRPGAGDDVLARARATANALARATGHVVEVAFCTHPAGPPVCWCRPPLPGLWLAFARRHHSDVRTSALHGASASDRTMARALGLAFVEL